jgi:PPOX class probable F420-dependent enzyme
MRIVSVAKRRPAQAQEALGEGLAERACQRTRDEDLRSRNVDYMTDDELTAFLLARPARTAKLAVTRRDGHPHVVPVWFDLDGHEVVFTTGRDTVKGRAIKRDGRVSLCVDDERPPFAYVKIDGDARVVDDADELLRWATRIGGRYMGEEQAEAYGRRNAVPTELLIRVRPTHAVGRTRISE